MAPRSPKDGNSVTLVPSRECSGTVRVLELPLTILHACHASIVDADHPLGRSRSCFQVSRETWHVRIHRETVKHLPIEIPPKAAKRFAWNFFPPSGLPRGRFTVKSGEAACRLRNADICASVAAAASRASSHRRNKFAPGAPSFEEKRERQGMYDPFLLHTTCQIDKLLATPCTMFVCNQSAPDGTFPRP